MKGFEAIASFRACVFCVTVSKNGGAKHSPLPSDGTAEMEFGGLLPDPFFFGRGCGS